MLLKVAYSQSKFVIDQKNLVKIVHKMSIVEWAGLFSFTAKEHVLVV